MRLASARGVSQSKHSMALARLRRSEAASRARGAAHEELRRCTALEETPWWWCAACEEPRLCAALRASSCRAGGAAGAAHVGPLELQLLPCTRPTRAAAVPMEVVALMLRCRIDALELEELVAVCCAAVLAMGEKKSSAVRNREKEEKVQVASLLAFF